MLRRRPLLQVIIIFLFSISLISAQYSVKGIVKDKNGAPVIGALVDLGTGENSAFTNALGKFTLFDVSDGSYSITISPDNRATLTLPINVSGSDLDVGELNVGELINSDEESDIAVISIGDIDAGGDDIDLAFSSVLSSGGDVFQDAASFNLFAGRFRARGYNNDRTLLHLNGMPVNDLDDGFIYWAAWGGLNDVFRNRSGNLSLNSSGIAFGGIGGSSSIDLRAKNQRPGVRARYTFSNRSYQQRVALTYNSGEREDGWSFSVSGARRWGNSGFIEGTYYDAWSYFASIGKEIGEKHNLNLVVFGAPLDRGRSSGSVQEMYDIVGSVYYNPNWGYQNGEVRNSRAYRSHQPFGILTHDFQISDNTKLITSLGVEVGNFGSTRLDWYLAPDPRPDYYRKLPSFQESDQARLQVEEYYKNNPDVWQIQWDRMYEINRNRFETINDVGGVPGAQVQGNLSAYVVEEQRFDNNKLSFNSIIESNVSSSLTLHGGINYLQERAENFKVLDDLLGGDFYLDLDEFAIRDFPNNPDASQNDLNNPNRVVREGDIFGYHYDINTTRAGTWGQATYTGDKLDGHISAEVSTTSFYRDGKFRSGRFPDNSFGKSETQSFSNYGIKGGLTYKLDGRNYLYANGTIRTKAPFARFSYLSARTRDQVVDGLTSESILGGEVGYIVRFPGLKGRVSGYYTEFKDQIDNISFYHDEERSFVNYVMTGIDKRHMGIEVGVEANLSSTLTLEFAGAHGEYIHTSRPTATITLDNNAGVLDEGRTVYLNNFYVPGTPQTAGSIGLNYRSPKFWFINLNVNFFDRSYLDFNPDRRTEVGTELVVKEEQPELWNSILEQERLDGQMTVDIFAGKSWRVDDYFIAFNLSVSNILNNQSFITGGFEQYRFDYEEKNINRFPPRYFYAYGTNFSANLSVSF